MNIAIVGMGKMGQAIKRVAADSSIEVKIEVNNYNHLANSDLREVDVAIEFTHPGHAYQNIKFLMEKGIPTISGTTGWLDKKSEIDEICIKENGAFLYASNFSIGMNITFMANQFMGQLFSRFPEFKVKLIEKHHIHKKDAPSGTAKTLADGIIEHYPDIFSSIACVREGEIIGFHEVEYYSDMENIALKHEALNRDVFAKGALTAAKWIVGRKGIFTFEDLIKG